MREEEVGGSVGGRSVGRQGRAAVSSGVGNPHLGPDPRLPCSVTPECNTATMLAAIWTGDAPIQCTVQLGRVYAVTATYTAKQRIMV